MRLEEIIKSALEEDIQTGDITTRATVDPDARGRARIIARRCGVICGLEIAEKVFHHLDNRLQITALCSDGDLVEPNHVLLQIEGGLPAILSGERVALNFLGRLSGVATLTRRFVEKVDGTGCTILDTRKTTPLLRGLEKYAVRVGGGKNHRSGLYDMYLIKENHIAAAGGIEAALEKVFGHRKENDSKALVEIEVTNLKELQIALKYPVDRILLDNMSVDEIRGAVRISGGKVKLEVSGGINLENVRAYAETGADFISVGQITHSAASLDVALLVEGG